MFDHCYVAIMAGGVGSRFWPASREERPKQFLDILGVGKTLIQLTAERFNKVVPWDRILVLTNESYVNLVKEQLPDIPMSNIIAEPSRNNTAPCNALVALKVFKENPKASLVIAPSDHVILKEESFLNNISKALKFSVSNNALVTLGITPSRPDTGYGYIEMGSESENGVFKVLNFKEKPDLEIAKSYVDSGNYSWNAGIFIWNASTIIDSFKLNAPEIVNVLSKDLDKLNTDSEKAYIAEVYPQTESISIDYAILEKANNVYTIPSDIGWSDLGTWNSLHAFSDKDDNGNVFLCKQYLAEDIKNTIIKSEENKMIVVNGLEDFIVIDEKDALLIYPKHKEQEIKAVRKSITDKRFL